MKKLFLSLAILCVLSINPTYKVRWFSHCYPEIIANPLIVERIFIMACQQAQSAIFVSQYEIVDETCVRYTFENSLFKVCATIEDEENTCFIQCYYESDEFDYDEFKDVLNVYLMYIPEDEDGEEYAL